MITGTDNWTLTRRRDGMMGHIPGGLWQVYIASCDRQTEMVTKQVGTHRPKLHQGNMYKRLEGISSEEALSQ